MNKVRTKLLSVFLFKNLKPLKSILVLLHICHLQKHYFLIFLHFYILLHNLKNIEKSVKKKNPLPTLDTRTTENEEIQFLFLFTYLKILGVLLTLARKNKKLHNTHTHSTMIDYKGKFIFLFKNKKISHSQKNV